MTLNLKFPVVNLSTALLLMLCAWVHPVSAEHAAAEPVTMNVAISSNDWYGGLTGYIGERVDFPFEVSLYGGDSTRVDRVVITTVVPQNTVYAAPPNLENPWSCAAGAPAGTVCTLTFARTPPVVLGSSLRASFPLTAVQPATAMTTWITQTFTASAPGTVDPDPSNNSLTVSRPLSLSNLRISVTSVLLDQNGDGLGGVGEEISHTARLFNAGIGAHAPFWFEAPSQDLVFYNPQLFVPPVLTPTATLSRGKVVDPHILSYFGAQIPELEPGGEVLIRYRTRIGEHDVTVKNALHQVTIRRPSAVTWRKDSEIIATPLEPRSALMLNLIADLEDPLFGYAFFRPVFRLKYRNRGAPVAAAQITATLQPGLIFDTLNGSPGWRCGATLCTFDTGPLDTSSDLAPVYGYVTFAVTTTAGTPDDITSISSTIRFGPVSGPPNLYAGRDGFDVSLPWGTPTTLSTTLTSVFVFDQYADGALNTGDVLRYTLWVTNTGSHAARIEIRDNHLTPPPATGGVTLLNILPKTIQDPRGASAVSIGAVLNARPGVLAAGDSFAIRYDAVLASASGYYTPTHALNASIVNDQYGRAFFSPVISIPVVFDKQYKLDHELDMPLIQSPKSVFLVNDVLTYVTRIENTGPGALKNLILVTGDNGSLDVADQPRCMKPVPGSIQTSAGLTSTLVRSGFGHTGYETRLDAVQPGGTATIRYQLVISTSAPNCAGSQLRFGSRDWVMADTGTYNGGRVALHATELYSAPFVTVSPLTFSVSLSPSVPLTSVAPGTPLVYSIRISNPAQEALYDIALDIAANPCVQLHPDQISGNFESVQVLDTQPLVLRVRLSPMPSFTITSLSIGATALAQSECGAAQLNAVLRDRELAAIAQTQHSIALAAGPAQPPPRSHRVLLPLVRRGA
jgi:hypothetical protein